MRASALPPAELIDPAGAALALQRARDSGLTLTDPERELVARLGAAAPAALDLLLQEPALLAALVAERANQRAVAPADAYAEAGDLSGLDDVALRAALRGARHRCLLRTTLRELYGDADVDRTAREWSRTASALTELALRAASATYARRDGPPLDAQGAPVGLVVLGMGKLGGEELNLGSDIDLCCFYGTDDGAAGERTLHEHFSRVVRAMVEHLDAVTERGFAFRVDLRLRPEGSRGPLANSVSSAETYYETWGRTWERAALSRARPIAGDPAVGAALLEALRPFVYRRRVEPSLATEMSNMLARARAELLRDPARDLKHGPGGIREAEFFVQSLQLIWGGVHPELRVAGTMSALARLRALGLVTAREADALSDAWGLLRRIEHRVQGLATAATHLLPEEPERLAALARSLGYAGPEPLLAALERARSTVRELFAGLLGEGERAPAHDDAVSRLAAHVAAGAERSVLASEAREALDLRDPEGAVDHLLRMGRRADWPLGAVGLEREPAVAHTLLAQVREAPDPDRALSWLAELSGRMHGAGRYLSLAARSPALATGLVGLLGTSDTLARTLVARPELLDAVLSAGARAPESGAMDALVRSVHAPDALDADERLEHEVGALRRLQHETLLHVGLADLAGGLSAGEITRRLSALAEALLARYVALAAGEAAARFGLREGTSEPLEGVVVCALGSLAARELGYGGDLDLLVLFDREAPTRGGTRAPVSSVEYVGWLLRRAMLLASSPHREGPGYEIDTRLRPGGAQGLLVTTLEGFAQWHRPQGQPARSARWEQQALLRTRCIAGDSVLGHAAEALMQELAYETGPADVPALTLLRARMERELAREQRGAMDLKYGPGSLVDVEFVAQVLQMAHGADPRVRTPCTRYALAALRDAGHLAPESATVLLGAEKLLRRALLATRLVAGRRLLVPGDPTSATVARKLGYRTQRDRGASLRLFDELREARAQVRQCFVELVGEPPAG